MSFIEGTLDVLDSILSPEWRQQEGRTKLACYLRNQGDSRAAYSLVRYSSATFHF